LGTRSANSLRHGQSTGRHGHRARHREESPPCVPSWANGPVVPQCVRSYELSPVSPAFPRWSRQFLQLIDVPSLAECDEHSVRFDDGVALRIVDEFAVGPLDADDHDTEVLVNAGGAE